MPSPVYSDFGMTHLLQLKLEQRQQRLEAGVRAGLTAAQKRVYARYTDLQVEYLLICKGQKKGVMADNNMTQALRQLKLEVSLRYLPPSSLFPCLPSSPFTHPPPHPPTDSQSSALTRPLTHPLTHGLTEPRTHPTTAVRLPTQILDISLGRHGQLR